MVKRQITSNFHANSLSHLNDGYERIKSSDLDRAVLTRRRQVILVAGTPVQPVDFREMSSYVLDRRIPFLKYVKMKLVRNLSKIKQDCERNNTYDITILNIILAIVKLIALNL